MGQCGDLDGFLKLGELPGILDDPHFVENRHEIGLNRPIPIRAGPGFQDIGDSAVSVMIGNRSPARQYPGQHLFEFLGGIGGIGAECFDGSLNSGSFPIPQSGHGSPGKDKKNEWMFRPGDENGSGLPLARQSRQVKKIVAGRRGDDRGLSRHLFEKALSSFFEDPDVESRGFQPGNEFLRQRGRNLRPRTAGRRDSEKARPDAENKAGGDESECFHRGFVSLDFYFGPSV